MNHIIIEYVLLAIFALQINVACTSISIFHAGNTLNDLDRCLCDLEKNAKNQWTLLGNQQLNAIIMLENNFGIEYQSVFGNANQGCLIRAKEEVCDLSLKAQAAIQRCLNQYSTEFQMRINSAQRCGAETRTSIDRVNRGTSLSWFCLDGTTTRGMNFISEYHRVINDLKYSYKSSESSMLRCFETVQNDFCKRLEELKCLLNDCINNNSRSMICDYNRNIFQYVLYRC